MSKQRTAEVFGFTGFGDTVKEAKQDAARQIEALQQGTFEPKVLQWQGEAILVYRTLYNWAYTFIQTKGGELKNSVSTTYVSGSREITIAGAQYHLAQAGWTFDDPVDFFPDFLTDEAVKRELISYREWQLKVRALILKGYDLDRARNIVDGRDVEDAAA